MTTKQDTTGFLIKPRVWILFVISGIFLLSIASCSTLGEATQRKKIVVFCSEPRLTASFDFHKNSREFLSSYYKTRKESELFFAWYASEDSVFMAKSVKKTSITMQFRIFCKKIKLFRS